MKIFMATMGLGIGGAETHIVELAKELKARGHEVVIASNGGVYVAEVEAAGIRHYAVPMHRRSVGDMLRSRTLLRRILREERPDIVHAHARIPAFLCGTLQRELGFPFVTSCHGVFQVSGMLKLLSNWGQRTLAVSEDIRDYLIQEYGVPAGHITLTINGIDTEKFSPGVSGEAVREEFCLGDDPVIGHVSRLDQASSLAARQLIELAPQLDRAAPGVRILITGGGDVFEELDRQAQEVNLKLGRPCVVLTGPRTDINVVAAACDLFVGVSRSALEAMAAEKPVVLSGAQGHTGLFRPELLEKAIDTNFCCRTDPIATEAVLLEAVTSALALPEEEKRALGRYGRQVVQEHYSVRRMAEDCLAVYDQVHRRRYHVVMSGYYGFSNAGDGGISPKAGRPVRPSAADLWDGDPVSSDAAQARPEHHRSGAPGHGGALLSPGYGHHPPGADGGAGGGRAVCGHAPAHPDFRRADGGTLHRPGVRPKGGELSPGAGYALRRPCGTIRPGGGHRLCRPHDGGL